MNTDQNPNDEPGRRPFGFWLKLVDRRLSEEMDSLFDADGISRRDWRVLNLLADRADDERLADRLRTKPHSLHRLAQRGWVAGFPPTLTDSGRQARDRLETQVDALRERVAGAVSPEDFATTLRSLEAIARELGWDESQPLPRGRRGGRRFGDHGHDHHEGAEHFGPHAHGLGRRRHWGAAPRQDVHVHVHLHDGHDGRDHGHGGDRPGWGRPRTA